MLPHRTRLLMKAALFLTGAFIAVLIVLQIALNSRPVERLVLRTASEYIDGNLQFSRMHFSFFKRFPTLRFSVDSLSLTYPHPRFSEYDSLYRNNRYVHSGRGEVIDTLAAFDRFVATVNVWKLVSWTVRLSDASVAGLRLYAHSYADSLVNWNVFRNVTDTVSVEKNSAAMRLPDISIGDISVTGPSCLVYTDGGDAYALEIDSLGVRTPSLNEFELSFRTEVRAMTGALGCLQLPVSLRAVAGLEQDDSLITVSLHYFKADIAGIPLSLSGKYETADAGSRIRAEVSIDSCEIRPLIDDYAVKFYPQIGGFVDEGVLTLKAKAEGPLSAGMPLDVDASAVLTASGSGVALNLDADACDILGKQLRIKLAAKGDADLNSLSFLLPDSLKASMDGRVALSLDADVSRRDLETMKFRSSSVQGLISSSSVRFSVDSLSAGLDRPTISISARPSGLGLTVCADTLAAVYGNALKLKLRGMSNHATLTKVEKRGTLRPRISLHNSEKSLFLRSGNNKFGLRGLDVNLAATRRGKGQSSRRKAILDSLQREYPMVSRDSLMYMLRAGSSFEGEEVLTVSLDSSVTRILNEWKPETSISLARGFVATPAFPLRTRVSAFRGDFNGNVLSLDTLSLTSGTSDLEMKGEIRGLRRLLAGRKGKISADVEVNSKYLNANELIAAAMVEADSSAVVGESENDESFVTDTLRNANPDSMLKRAPLVPANLDLVLRLHSDSLDYSNLHIKPLNATAAVKDRTLQLSRAMMRSNLGDIFLSAFYSTKSRSDISAGLDMRLQDISADGIIQMLPTVDNILPALKSFQGDLNCDLTLTGKVDSSLNLIMPTLNGALKIGGENLYIADAGDLKRITRLLLFKNKDIGEIQNMTVSGIIHDNRLEVYPFELDVDRYKLALQGIQGFDKRMDYHISVMKSPLLIPFGIRLFGDGDKWKFRLTSAKYRSGHVPAYTEALDTVRVNIRNSIMEIFRMGASRARMQNSEAAQNALRIYSSAVPDADLNEKDQAALDLAMLEAETDEQTRAIDEEANAVLAKNTFNVNSEAFRLEMEKSRVARKAARNAERQKTRKK